jgi:hypothetical protein
MRRRLIARALLLLLLLRAHGHGCLKESVATRRQVQNVIRGKSTAEHSQPLPVLMGPRSPLGSTVSASPHWRRQ